jgi:hypothetical protein
MLILVPPSLLFGGHGCGLAWSRPIISIYCSAEIVCVEPNLHSPPCVHGTHKNNCTDTRLHRKLWIRFLSEELLLHTYCWVQLASAIPGHKWQFWVQLASAIPGHKWQCLDQLASAIPGHKWQCVFLPWIGVLVAVTFCGFVQTRHSLKLFGWCRDVASDPVVSVAKG